MEKFIVKLRTVGDIIEIQVEEVDKVTTELRPYVIDLPTLATFLQSMGRARGSQLQEHWQREEFALIERREII